MKHNLSTTPITDWRVRCYNASHPPEENGRRLALSWTAPETGYRHDIVFTPEDLPAREQIPTLRLPWAVSDLSTDVVFTPFGMNVYGSLRGQRSSGNTISCQGDSLFIPGNGWVMLDRLRMLWDKQVTCPFSWRHCYGKAPFSVEPLSLTAIVRRVSEPLLAAKAILHWRQRLQAHHWPEFVQALRTYCQGANLYASNNPSEWFFDGLFPGGVGFIGGIVLYRDGGFGVHT